MTKLKTSRDLVFELSNMPTNKYSKNYYTESLGGAGKFIDPKELKAEAVKWIKESRKRHSGILEADIEKWIKHFFNLTEEEIKNDRT